MLMQHLSLALTHTGLYGWRTPTASLLRAASRALERLALRLAFERPETLHEPVREFYAEAGAPEGALYVDGRLVGHIVGVKRL